MNCGILLIRSQTLLLRKLTAVCTLSSLQRQNALCLINLRESTSHHLCTPVHFISAISEDIYNQCDVIVFKKCLCPLQCRLVSVINSHSNKSFFKICSNPTAWPSSTELSFKALSLLYSREGSDCN